MKTLYVSDLDGTLLRKDGTVSPEAARILNTLYERGVSFTYATARSLNSAAPATDGFRTIAPVIIYNGAAIVDRYTGEALSSISFTPAELAIAIERLNRLGASPLIYARIDGRDRVSWITGNENEGLAHYVGKRKRAGDPRMRPLPSQEGLFAGEVFYFTCIGEEAALRPVYDAFDGQAAFHAILQQEIYRSEYWCELMPRGATKGQALARLKALLGCERVVAFGDAINDLSLFEAADECYAVANASEQVKSAATAVIQSNEEDGVAHWLAAHAEN